MNVEPRHLLPGVDSRDAPAIVLIHGFPSSSRMFKNLIQVLADQLHIVASYDEGLREFWEPLKAFWNERTPNKEVAL